MKYYSKVFAGALGIVLLFSLSPTAYATESIENFARVNTYLNGHFSDVQISDWFNNNVGKAFELGLMLGNSETTFNPTGDITIAETIVLACRLHSIYHADGETFTQGSPWYKVYVEYAINNKIITYCHRRDIIDPNRRRKLTHPRITATMVEKGLWSEADVKEWDDNYDTGESAAWVKRLCHRKRAENI